MHMVKTNNSWNHVYSTLSHQSCNYKITKSLEFAYKALVVPLELVEEDIAITIFLFDLHKSCNVPEFSYSPLFTPTSILGFEIPTTPNLVPHISNACVWLNCGQIYTSYLKISTTRGIDMGLKWYLCYEKGKI